MVKKSKHEAAIPNPALKPLSILVGEWNTVGKHRLIPNTTLHGHVSFAWLEGGAFLIMHSEIEEEVGIPTTIAIFGSDNVKEELYMLSFDERGVSRKEEMTLRDNVWKHWRDMPGFSQRFTGIISDDENTITGVSELNEDGTTWQRDLELIYTRVK